jgi:hypothetical protein
VQPPCQVVIDIARIRLKQIVRAGCGKTAALGLFAGTIGTFVKNGGCAVKNTTRSSPKLPLTPSPSPTTRRGKKRWIGKILGIGPFVVYADTWRCFLFLPLGKPAMRRLFFLAVVLVAASALPGRADPDDKKDQSKAPPTDEEQLQTAKVAVDGPGLLDFFRKRMPTEKERLQVEGLIGKLAHDSFAVRQKASADLLKMGPAALPQLRRALQHEDEEVRQRARDALEVLDEHVSPDLVAAAVRLLEKRRPAGATPVLLEYLPGAEDDMVAEELLNALAVLGVHDAKVDPVLVAALKEKVPERRAAAALVVGRSGSAEQRAAVQSLLADPEVSVRFQAGRGLLAARDKNAVPALLALLAEGSPEMAVQVEDILCCLAGMRAPRTPLGDSEASRRHCRDVWAAWWKVYSGRIDLARADVDLPPNNLILQGRIVTRRFLNALFSADLVAFQKTTDVPFTMLDDQTYTTRDDLDKFFTANPTPARQKPILEVRRQLSVDEFVRAVPKEDKEAVNKMRKPENKVIAVHATIDGQAQDLAVFVRAVNGRVLVIGCGPDKTPNRPGN